MIHVIASIYIKEGKRSEFIDIFKANVPDVLQEKGCLEYVPTLDTPSGLPLQKLNDRVVTILEKWESLEHLHTHLSAPHMLSYKDQVAGLVEKMTLKILEPV